ncbi:MAG TPA: SDR family oxidoreductase [Blastocatellia bacterium]|jgi:NAD(P)-dependent dehydrogenase (short-subunit alcohol dehydrogenase family)|nr:SDR family oxidoreductase [Blastocatellia bacterium]
MRRLEGKIALITGANRGIGRGIAEAFAAEGAALTLTARDAALLNETAEALRQRTQSGDAIFAVPADVTDEKQVQEVFRQAIDRFGRLDILVNNAGTFAGYGPIDEVSVESWDWTIAVNLRGPFLCTREAFRIMKRQRGGRIINIGSIASQRVRLHSAAYSTTKHGLWGLTQVTALEGRNHGISCGVLNPGNVMIEKRAGDPEPMMSVEEIAQAAVAMAELPPHVNMLEATVLPIEQLFLGRG